MNTPNYTDTMSAHAKSAHAKPPVQKLREFWRGTWGGVLTAAVVGNLILWQTDLPGWILSAAGVVIIATVLVCEWSKRRRREAENDQRTDCTK